MDGFHNWDSKSSQLVTVFAVWGTHRKQIGFETVDSVKVQTRRREFYLQLNVKKKTMKIKSLLIVIWLR